MRPLPALLACFLLAPALALAASGGAPISLGHSGYLLDTNDAPPTATLAMTFRVATDLTAGTVQWEGTCAGVAVREGYYAVVLGSAACVGSTAGGLDATLDTSDVPVGAARWLEVQVGAVTLSPRLALTAAPTAMLASRALTADLLGTHPPSDFASAVHAHAIGEVTGLQAALDAGAVVTADAPLTGSGTTSSHLSIPPASTTANGYLSSANFNTFNNKVSSVTAGTAITLGGTATAPTVGVNVGTTAGTVAAGDDARFGAGITADAPLTGAGTSASHLSLPPASTTVNGYLSSASFNTFNNKVSSVTAGTAITIGGTATAPTVGVNVGTTAGTVAAGDDPRFAAVGTGIQNQSATPQAASFNISGSGAIGGNLGIGSTSAGATLDLGARKDGLVLPRGLSSERQASPALGTFRYNTTINRPEYFNGTVWVGLAPFLPGSGGSITDVGAFRLHTFTTSGTFVANQAITADVLVVAGGGSGGSNDGGGGGGGGVQYVTNFSIPQGTYAVTVGAGAPATLPSGSSGVRGSNSTFHTLTSIGGGGGTGGNSGVGTTGGSGGGDSRGRAGGGLAGTSGQGFAGAAHVGANIGGGGGGGGAPASGRNGGAGLSVSITGSAVFYGGGGGAGDESTGTSAPGGAGGGGNGGWTSHHAGYDGAPNTGGGGGGDFNGDTGGGAGGSGIVIIRYPIP